MVAHAETQVAEVSVGSDWVMVLVACFVIASPCTQVGVGREISRLDPFEA